MSSIVVECNDNDEHLEKGFYITGRSRCIIREKDPRTRRLSLNDRNIYLGLQGPEPNTRATEVRLSHEQGDVHGSLQGYPIHPQCWTFVKRIFGRDVSKHLDSMVEAFRREKEQHPPSNRLPIEFSDRSLPDIIHHIPGMSRLLEIGREYVSEWPSELPRLKSAAFDVPEEIKYAILDRVHYKDVFNLLYAFQWEISQSYWCSRFPRRNIFEVKNHFDTDDWCLFCVEAESLADKCGALQNRGDLWDSLLKVRVFYREIRAAEDNMLAATE